MSEGSTYRRKDGRWVAKWKDANGKWCYLYRKTKADAKKTLRQALKDRDDHIVLVGKLTLNNLLDSWLEDMDGTVSRRTSENRQCAILVSTLDLQSAHRGFQSSLTRISQGSTGLR
jgi:transposase-like protein